MWPAERQVAILKLSDDLRRQYFACLATHLANSRSALFIRVCQPNDAELVARRDNGNVRRVWFLPFLFFYKPDHQSKWFADSF